MGTPNAKLPECLINGQPANQIAITDRGLNYGDGLFETVRVSQGRIALLDYHLARLERGLQALKMKADLLQVAQEWQDLAALMGEGVIKLTLTRGLGQRGYAIPADAQPVRIQQCLPPVVYPLEHARDGVRLFPCTTQLARQPLLAGIKHLNRLEQVLARSEWTDTQFAEGLVCDTLGLPIECTMGNLFVREGDQWLTPSLAKCGVRGVMRDYLLDHLRAQGEQVEEVALDYAQLMTATELFCCNSLYGVWPIIALEQQTWPIGPHTRYAQALAEQVLK
ncbi:MAG: aminodeoxychorismate lyase [Pseudoalteromonas distincta]